MTLFKGVTIKDRTELKTFCMNTTWRVFFGHYECVDIIPLAYREG